MKSQEKLQKSQFLFLSKQIYNLSPLTEHDHVFTQILYSHCMYGHLAPPNHDQYEQ